MIKFREGHCSRVYIFHGMDIITAVVDAHVTVYETGIVHIIHPDEETTMHISNCEVQWEFKDETDPKDKIRVLSKREPVTPSTE